MPRLHNQNLHASSESRIREEPLSETIAPKWFRSIKRRVATAMAAVGLTTGFGFTSACSDSKFSEGTKAIEVRFLSDKFHIT